MRLRLTTFWPAWAIVLTLGLAAMPSAAAAANVIAPGSPTSCITPAHPSVSVPVGISRTDATAVRGFSVTFTVSSALALSAGTSSITEGTYLSSGFSTSFIVTDNGGGSYTADGVILGPSCGATASSGTLFNIGVTNAVGSGTGTITVTSVKLRDCNNLPLAVSAGSATSVTIDPAPVTVASIANQTVAETALLTVTPSASLTGCASGPLTWTATGLPAGASISSSTGVVTWTPGCSAAETNGGNYGPVTVTATAASGDHASASFNIHVTDTPGTVTVSVTSPPSVEESSALAMAAPSAALAGCAAGPVAWSVSPALPTGATLSSSTGVVSWTPSCGQAGGYGPFTLTATAATGETGTGSFSLTVTHKVGTVTVAVTSPPSVQEQDRKSVV